MSECKEYIVKVYKDRTAWYNKDGQFHREDGPADEWANGDKFWYKNGLLHREGGPACEYAIGDKIWYLNGKLHREDGPAVEYASGYNGWYINNKQFTEEEFKTWTKPCAIKNKTIEIDGKKYKLIEI